MRTKFLLFGAAICCIFAWHSSDAQELNKPASQPVTWSSSGALFTTPAHIPAELTNANRPGNGKPRYIHKQPALSKSDRADAPENDEPCGVPADELVIGQTLSWTGTTEGSDDGEVWQAFTITTCTNVSFNWCGTSPAYSIDYVSLWDGECALFSNNYYPPYDAPDCGDGNPISTFYTLQPGTYFLPVYQVSPDNLTYSVSVTAAECAPAPLNDDACSVTPEALSIGSTLQWSGTTAGAVNQDVWQAFTLSTCANVILNWCGSSPSFYSAGFVIMGECDAPENYFFSSPATVDCGDGNPTGKIYSLQPGTYYLPIFDLTGGPGSDYSVMLSAEECAPVPPNDLICDATVQSLAIGDSVTFEGTLAGSTDTEGNDQVSVWEAFTLTECADVTFNWCGSMSADQWYSFSLVSGDCNDPDSWMTSSLVTRPDSCADGSSIKIAYILNPGTYYIQILDPDGSFPEYELTASASNCSPLPANDNCSSVTALVLTPAASVTFTGNTIGASSAGDFGPGWTQAQFPTLWHAFTINSCSHVTVQYCATTPAFGNVWSFISSTCPADSVFIPGSSNYQQCEGNATIIYYDLPAGTYYLPVMQNGNTATGPYSITVSAESCGSYCIGYALNTVPFYEKIANINFAGIDNSSESGLGYEDFTAVTDTVIKGESYPLTITLSNGYPGDNVRVWIDYDQDNSFSALELVFTSDTSAGPYNSNIEIPEGAVTGNTRMRVRMDDMAPGHGSNPDPCGYATYGQVEDYTLFIDTETGINSVNSDSWTIYPNPGNGNFTLRNGGESVNVTIEIIDISGRIIFAEKSVMAPNATYSVSEQGSIAPGIYNVRITTKDNQVTKRILVW